MKTNKISVLFLTVALVVAAGLVSCVTSAQTGRTSFNIVSQKEELEMGEAAYQDVLAKNPISKNQAQINRLKKITDRLIVSVGNEMPNARWEFNIIESDTVNAFALPGGKIAVYSGLMALATDDELAYVIGHEIAHVTLRHGTERMSQQMAVEMVGNVGSVLLAGKSEKTSKAFLSAYGLGASVGIMLPHSRRNELEADKVGVLYSSKAGYNPEASISLLNKFASMTQGGKTPEFLSTHPLDSTRIDALQKAMPEMQSVYQKAK